MHRARRVVFALLLLSAFVFLPRAAHAEPGDELTISVLTFGPGDHPFFKFGHNAILVHDDSRRDVRSDLVYNFGTFAFESWTLIPNFFRGKLRYWLSIQSLRGTIALYKSENRTIDAQVLDLTAAQKREIAAALAENALPENRYYKYDYYADNCSTRVRDAVDKVVGGRVLAASQDRGAMTWREHTMRLTADDVPVALGLDVAMGDFIDHPRRVWEEMFLPSKLQETLRKVTIPGKDGAMIPLVKSESRLLEAPGRAPLRVAPPAWKLPLVVVGLLIGGALAGLGVKGTKAGWARALFGASVGLIGLVTGFLGCLFVMFWTATDHQVAWRNENILQCTPFVIALVVYGPKVALGRAAAIRTAAKLLLVAAGASALGLLMKAMPWWFDQQNGRILALMLPLWAGAAFGAWTLAGRGNPFAPASPVGAAPAPAPAPAAAPPDAKPEADVLRTRQRVRVMRRFEGVRHGEDDRRRQAGARGRSRRPTVSPARRASVPGRGWMFPDIGWVCPNIGWVFSDIRWVCPNIRWVFPDIRWVCPNIRWVCPNIRWMFPDIRWALPGTNRPQADQRAFGAFLRQIVASDAGDGRRFRVRRVGSPEDVARTSGGRQGTRT